MNSLVRIVLVGPTGSGKSQFCNFIHNDLTNSLYEVSDSLNSCTTEPKSNVVERQNIQLELIDSPGSSDTNNSDEENLKKLVLFLRLKKQINQILLILSFENRLSNDTRNYLKILSWTFTPIEFFSNLIIIFTHYPIDPDDEDKSKLNKLKREINVELKKIFDIQENDSNLLAIPVYFINTKIQKRNGKKNFDENSIMASNMMVEEIKLRMSSLSYKAIDTTNLDCNPQTIKSRIQQQMDELNKHIKELKLKKEQAEKEEKEYENFISSRACNNRTTINGSKINSIVEFLHGLAALANALSSCEIF